MRIDDEEGRRRRKKCQAENRAFSLPQQPAEAAHVGLAISDIGRITGAGARRTFDFLTEQHSATQGTHATPKQL